MGNVTTVAVGLVTAMAKGTVTAVAPNWQLHGLNANLPWLSHHWSIHTLPSNLEFATVGQWEKGKKDMISNLCIVEHVILLAEVLKNVSKRNIMDGSGKYI